MIPNYDTESTLSEFLFPLEIPQLPLVSFQETFWVTIMFSQSKVYEFLYELTFSC